MINDLIFLSKTLVFITGFLKESFVNSCYSEPGFVIERQIKKTLELKKKNAKITKKKKKNSMPKIKKIARKSLKNKNLKRS